MRVRCWTRSIAASAVRPLSIASLMRRFQPVVSEHAVGLDDLLVFAADAEFGLAGEMVDLLAHAVEGEVEALALGLDILGHGVFDGDAGLVVDGVADGEALDQGQAFQLLRAALAFAEAERIVLVDEIGVGDQFGEHHGDGLQRLDLDLFVAARLHVLDAEHADRLLPADDRDAGEGVELVLAGFRAIGEVRVSGGFGEVERLDLAGDGADQTLADGHAGDVDGFLGEAAGGEQLQHAFAKEVDRADLGIEALADDIDHGVELVLGGCARGHDFVQPGQDQARRGDGGRDGAEGTGVHGAGHATAGSGRLVRHAPERCRPGSGGTHPRAFSGGAKSSGANSRVDMPMPVRPRSAVRTGAGLRDQ